MTSIVWLNGELVEQQHAKVSVFDHGFTVADGIFETLKIVNGEVFALQRHLNRLQHSANVLDIGDIDLDLVAQGCSEILGANPSVKSGRMRITVTTGAGPLGSDRLASPLSIVIALAEAKPWPATTSVAVVPWPRNERSSIAGAKTTSYAENVVALNAAHAAGFSEAILIDTRGNISEGTGTNVFIVKDGVVLTPAEDTGLLQGVTRNLAIEWGRAAGIGIHEGHFTTADLLEADEVFITSSTRDVHPVTEIGVMAPDKKVVTKISMPAGPITAQLREIFIDNASTLVNP